jgi:hypothetical protein
MLLYLVALAQEQVPRPGYSAPYVRPVQLHDSSTTKEPLAMRQVAGLEGLTLAAA